MHTPQKVSECFFNGNKKKELSLKKPTHHHVSRERAVQPQPVEDFLPGRVHKRGHHGWADERKAGGRKADAGGRAVSGGRRRACCGGQPAAEVHAARAHHLGDARGLGRGPPVAQRVEQRSFAWRTP